MPAATAGARGEHVPTADHRVVLHGLPWSHFEVMLALRGEAPVPRVAYLQGALELMRPSRDHERIKSYIGRLIEAYAMERGLDLSPYGAWTLKKAFKEAGAEPDECHIIGSDQHQDVPDLVIEVAWTPGGLDKLEIYRRLGIRELWVWQDEHIQVIVLAPEGYERSVSSACFPQLDGELLTSFLEQPTALQAVRAFRKALAD
ncbi:MAG: Uma2 family endonuclease [Candidatus Schekmanbacteria bacterium]|nr:Uma2 family endonuclease [Candidatus Schekmanbacteria bacterium]